MRIFKNGTTCSTWWHMLTIPETGRLKEEHREFKASLGCIVLTPFQQQQKT
jgi:hypothetical protein